MVTEAEQEKGRGNVKAVGEEDSALPAETVAGKEEQIQNFES